MAETVSISGLEGYTRNLASANKIIKKAGRAGLQAGMRETAKHIRHQITALSIETRIKAALRKTVGGGVKQVKGEWTIKAGLGAGKQTKKRKAEAAARSADKTLKGVGIGKQNIHWFTLGTYSKKGQGPLKGFEGLDDVVKLAVRLHKRDIVNAAAKKYKDTNERLLRKLRKQT